ncbi:MAG: glycosyltransferase [Arcanobacterium sp.]|nr:glycosyltransferase [Arcanobacterium sp.]
MSRIFSPEPAAAALRLNALATGLHKHGLKVTVETTKLAANSEKIAQDFDRKQDYVINRHRVKRGKDGYLKGYLQYMSFDIPMFFRMLLGKQPDIYVVEPPPTTGFFTALVSKIRRVPFVYYAADIWSDAAASTAPKAVVAALRSVEKFVLRHAQTVIAVSEEVGERTKELGAKSVSVVLNGIDTNIFTPVFDVEKTSTAEDSNTAKYFIYAGTSSQWQGAEIFALAMEQLAQKYPEYGLVYLGQGSSADTIAQIASRLPSGIIQQLGQVPVEIAAKWQRESIAALVSIKPGMGYDFAVPTKTFAALASGVPVIYVGVGPLRELITENNLGFIADYELSAVVNAMEEAIQKQEIWQLENQELAVSWVRENRSIETTGTQAAGVILKELAK